MQERLLKDTRENPPDNTVLERLPENAREGGPGIVHFLLCCLDLVAGTQHLDRKTDANIFNLQEMTTNICISVLF
jgi:hypothetical protein